MKRGFITVFAFSLAFAPAVLDVPTARAATLAGGDLMKLMDDGNPATTVDAAVYYYGADGRRYVFPSDKTYFTWYADFSGVKAVDAATMASAPLGGNVTYRPGIRMVKIQSDPKVYAVAKNGTLRPIADEAAATALYGADWNTKIDDISDAFFVDYRIGEEIASASDFDSSAEATASLTIGADKGLVPPPETFPISDDEPNFTVEAYGLPSKGPFVAGSTGVTLGVFALKASTTSVNTVLRVRFQAYVDEREGVVGFGKGFDNDDGTVTFARDLVAEVGLYDASGAQLAAPKGLDASGAVEFSDLAIAIPPGQVFVVRLKGDIGASIAPGNLSDYLAFDIVDLATDVTVMGSSGETIPAVGGLPNGGTSAAAYVELVASGSMTFEWKGVNGNVIAGRESAMGTLEITVTGEDFALEELTLRATGTLEAPASYRLSYLNVAGLVEEATVSYQGNLTTFTGLPFVLAKGRKNIIQVRMTLHPQKNDFHGERIRLEVHAADSMGFRSVVSGKVYDETAFEIQPADFRISGVMTDVYVRFSEMAFALLADSPSGPIAKGAEVGVLRFRITAAPEGGIRVKRLTFKLVPGDANTSGPDNDALERWADLNGDAPDDNAVVNLRQTSPSLSDPIGEDAFARLSYSIVHEGVKDTTPSDVVSSPNDYALIEYDFSQDHELKIPAGTSIEYLFELDTTRFALGSHTLDVSILGAHDIQWTDRYEGSFTPISGEVIAGLPLEGYDLTVVQ